VLAPEHLLGLGGLDLHGQRVKGARQLGQHVLSLACPLGQHGEIVFALSEALDEIALFLEPVAALEDLLRFGLIFPEIGRGGALFELRQLLGRVRGFKDNLEVPRNA
jgi:hypothetical protein